MPIFRKAELTFRHSVELLISNMLAFIGLMKGLLLKMLQEDVFAKQDG